MGLVVEDKHSKVSHCVANVQICKLISVHILSTYDNCFHLCRTMQQSLNAADNSAPGTTVAPAGATAAVASTPANGDTVHFKLSSHDLHQGENSPQIHSRPSSSNTTTQQHTAAAIPSPTLTPAHSRQSQYLNYNGPDVYVKPQSKSNKKIIKNALCHVCLAGEVNLSLKQRALAVSTIYSMH